MDHFKSKCRAGILLVFTTVVALTAFYGLTKPLSNRCVMTYMYPTYIPITMKNVPSYKYGLFLYHEGWQEINHVEHLNNLDGVPVLFIPGNGGSYKQVRSIAAESSRAFQNGPLEQYLYQTVSSHPWIGLSEEHELFNNPSQYSQKLDWFAVDLEGEHSAMDASILHKHTEYVVYAIHRILDQYKESEKHKPKNVGDSPQRLPRSVVLLGHSMGGFVARAALVHPRLRKSAVQTIITLSSPHKYPPIALQPSLGQYFSQVNGEWIKGYNTQALSAGQLRSSPTLSTVAVISIFGGINDYQVRSNFASLDGIVPPTHGLTLGTSGMRNVWLSTEHQTILWCNQLVVQLSHTILSMIDPGTRLPFSSASKRLLIARNMLQSAIPYALNGLLHGSIVGSVSGTSSHLSDRSNTTVMKRSSCPPIISWSSDGLGRDLFVQSSLLTILAMDGRRRWINIKELGSNGQKHFIFVTNLSPCHGVRVHLWPERHNSSIASGIPTSKIVTEVTSRLVEVPAGHAPKQGEPGSQTEQPPPSSFLLLTPDEMRGFLYITISVAPQPMISGRPPPSASMGVAQFFDPADGAWEFSARQLVSLGYAQEIYLPEDHPLAINLSFLVSLGLFPATLSMKTVSCGIKDSAGQIGESEQNSLCKARCFPPMAFAWDYISGLHVIPDIYSGDVAVDSSPATWEIKQGMEKTVVLILGDPHCSYRLGVSFSFAAAASRLFLLHSSQIVGFMICIVLFAHVTQSHALELDSSVPSLLTAIELNLRIPSPFLLLWLIPTVFHIAFSSLSSRRLPPFASFLSVSLVCYILANGFMIVLVLSSKLFLHASAMFHVSIKRRLQVREHSIHSALPQRIQTIFLPLYSMKIIQVVNSNSYVLIACVAIVLVCCAHPAIGLGLELLFQAYCALFALSSSLAAASLRSQVRRKDSTELNDNAGVPSAANRAKNGSELQASGSPTSVKSFGESQLEVFNYRHGIVILHLLATLMFLPSLVSWSQKIGIGQGLPMIQDSVLCVGVILHGLFGSSPDSYFISFTLPYSSGPEVGLSSAYLLAGYYTFVSSLAMAPYRAFYAMAALGASCTVSRFIEHRARARGDSLSRRMVRKHSHKH